MIELAHLFDIDFELGAIDTVGDTPLGRRVIGNLGGGTFTGERLRGRIHPSGGDWGLFHPDGTLVVDGRCCFETDDGALIYGIYKGRWCIEPAVMARLRTSEEIAAHDPGEYYLRIHWLFEAASDSPYAWLNRIIAIGSGRRTAAGIAYEVWEVR